jgi:GNAT superfamily N-acetyltransferase
MTSQIPTDTTTTIHFRPPNKEEYDTLVQLGNNHGIFGPGEADELLGQTLLKIWNGTLPLHHQAHVLVHNNTIKGWVYFGPTLEDPQTWNLWWIGVDHTCKGQGFGKQLLHFVENTVKLHHAKHLLIETSSLDLFTQTREFYKRQGYYRSVVERDGYGPGEDKIVFKKDFFL